MQVKGKADAIKNIGHMGVNRFQKDIREDKQSEDQKLEQDHARSITAQHIQERNFFAIQPTDVVARTTHIPW